MEPETKKVYEHEGDSCGLCPFESDGWCNLYDEPLSYEDNLLTPDFCKLVRVLVIEKEKE